MKSTADMSSTGRNRTYGYDGAGRLDWVIGRFGEIDYEYDPLGNLRKKTQAGGTEEPDPFRRDYLYDDRGNVEADGVRSYVSDSSNQPVSMGGLAAATYQYDGHMRRAVQAILGRKVRSVYSLSGQLLHRHDVTGGKRTDYVTAGGLSVVRLENGSPTYIASDHLGSASVGSDSPGAAKLVGLAEVPASDFDRWSIGLPEDRAVVEVGVVVLHRLGEHSALLAVDALVGAAA
jgi:hypothetical protein